MRTWKLWLLVLVVPAGCSDSSSSRLHVAAGPDAAADSKPAVDAPVGGPEIGGAAGGTGGAVISTGGRTGAGGTTGAGGVVPPITTGMGGMPGTGGGGGVGPSGTGGGTPPLDAAAAAFDMGPASPDAGLDAAQDRAGESETTSVLDGTDGTTASDGAAPIPVLALVPRSNAVPGWTVDPTNPTTAGRIAAVATTETETTNLIDGAAANFYAGSAKPTTFAWQSYVNAGLTSARGDSEAAGLTLYLLQMPTAEASCALYTSLRQANLYAGNTWAEPTSPPLGTNSRITDSGTDWWINFCKGDYYVEVRMSPSYGPAPDYAPSDPSLKQAAMGFAAAVAAKM